MYSLSLLFIQLPILNSSYRTAAFSGNALTTNTSQNYSHIQLKRAAEATLGGYDVGLNERVAYAARRNPSYVMPHTECLMLIVVRDPQTTRSAQQPSRCRVRQTTCGLLSHTLNPNTLYHGQFLPRSKGRF